MLSLTYHRIPSDNINEYLFKLRRFLFV